MQYVALLTAFVIFVVGCWVTYDEEFRQSWWYMPFGMFLGALLAGVWYWVCRLMPERRDIYVFSLIWDSLMVAVYYGMPLLFFGVRLDKMTAVGAALIMAGIMVIKAKA